ncbi:MAG: hypothetical protein ACI8RA_001331, partial [Chlamydiales bacterium]
GYYIRTYDSSNANYILFFSIGPRNLRSGYMNCSLLAFNDLRSMSALNLKLIDQQLKIRIPIHRKSLEEGRNANAEHLSLNMKRSLCEIFTASPKAKKVFTGKIQAGKSLYKSLIDEGWNPSETMSLIHQLQGSINIEQVHPEDLFMIKMREGVVTDFTLVHKGEVSHLDVINNRFDNTKEEL